MSFCASADIAASKVIEKIAPSFMVLLVIGRRSAAGVSISQVVRCYFSEALKGVVPSVALPAQVLLRNVMICAPKTARAPVFVLPLIRQSDIRTVVAEP